MARGAILAAGVVALAILASVCLPRHLPVALSNSSLSPATFYARLEGTALTLRGSVPSERVKAQILTRAQDVYGQTHVRIIDQLSIDPHVGDAPWLSAIPGVLPILNRMSEHGSLIIDGHSLVLSGRVESERAKAALLADAAPLIASGLELENHVFLNSRPAASLPLQAKLDDVLKRSGISFESNSAKISSRSRATLDKLASLLRQAPKVSVEIAGHTDGYGTVEYNLHLSRRRAEAVREYFLTRGLSNRFMTVGYGAAKPVSSDRSQTGLRRNRRIELRVKGNGDL